jgi:hypothetical protein
MAYIGTKPTIGNFQICDAISVVNGQAAYTMQVGSVNVIPQSANHMIVSLNGTIQKPNSSFTVSGAVITFSSNLVTNDVIDFIQILGDVLDLGVPSDATVTTAKLASDSVTYEKIGYNANQFRNIIINGDMSIAQRSTSVSGITGADYYTVDRWQIYISSLGTWTQSQSTDVPTGQGFSKSLKFDCTTADASPAASDQFYVRTKFEGQNLQYLKYGTSSAESMTLSFWVKCNKATTASVQLQDHDNSKMVTKSYTINSADTWEKKTITFNGNTSNSFTNDNGLSLDVRWWLDSGSDFTSETPSGDWEANDNTKRNNNNLGLASSTSNEWYITGVQLEVGSAASDFEFLPVDVNLKRCQRYYVNNIQIGGAGYATSSGQNARARTTVIFPTTMRATPSTSVANYNGGNVQNTVAFDSTNTIGTMPSGEAAASGSIYWDADLTIDAEL